MIVEFLYCLNEAISPDFCIKLMLSLSPRVPQVIRNRLPNVRYNLACVKIQNSGNIFESLTMQCKTF